MIAAFWVGVFILCVLQAVAFIGGTGMAIVVALVGLVLYWCRAGAILLKMYFDEEVWSRELFWDTVKHLAKTLLFLSAPLCAMVTLYCVYVICKILILSIFFD